MSDILRQVDEDLRKREGIQLLKSYGIPNCLNSCYCINYKLSTNL